MSALSRLISIQGVIRPTCPTEGGTPEPSESIALDLPENLEVALKATSPSVQETVSDSVEFPQDLNDRK
jgi:hypothetical protein